MTWKPERGPKCLAWISGEGDEVPLWLTADERTWAMLLGIEGGVVNAESESRFLEGRRGTVSSKSLAKGIEERQSNAGASRDIKRRAWPRSPWESRLSDLMEVLLWSLSLRWDDCRKEEEHINILETRARWRLVSRLARNVSTHSQRHLHVTDSRVTEAVTLRGRSSSRRLNRELRLSLPDVVGGGLTVPTFWVESARMTADEPSRKRSILDAAVPSPDEVAIQLVEGNLASKTFASSSEVGVRISGSASQRSQNAESSSGKGP